MATRSHIAFYERPEQPLEQPSILLHRHSDGYPSSVLPDILPFLQWFHAERGLDDGEYAAARLLQHLCNRYDEAIAAISFENGRIPEETPFTGTLGYGICPTNTLHGDIEFLYAVTSNPQVSIHHNAASFGEQARFSRLGFVDLAGDTVFTPRAASFLGECFEHKLADEA
ncbi:MAG: hypothetical protein K9H25_11505 [Rhodospirillum sp.]|nr:hypothetical protein [Rhodospirillum sp.]MCF8489821.1 hypothetical protein [Rhodospirillum sp.]MCF8501061.1 hypothetical protein [Rhodospirillum sp.]